MTYWDMLTLRCDMSDSDMFVDREKELRFLAEYYRQCLEFGVNCGVLVYMGGGVLGKQLCSRGLLMKMMVSILVVLG